MPHRANINYILAFTSRSITSHTEQGKAYDEERSQILNLYDLEVLRFTNLELDQQFDAVCEVIDREVKARM